MKKYLLILFVTIIAITTISAQTKASAAWQLIADQNATVVGNVVGEPATGFGGIAVKDYSGKSLSGPLSTSQASWNVAANWPVNNTDDTQSNIVYVDFVVSPKAGNDLKVDSVYAWLGGGGTGNMRANLYFGGTDTSLATLTKLNTAGVLFLKQASQLTGAGRAAEDTSVAYKVGVTVKNGQKFRFRIYPWYKSATASATRYLVTQNIMIKGTTSAAVAVEQVNGLPSAYNLEQNYPNPFNPSTKISFSIPQTGFTRLVVYNLLGKEVAQLVNRNLNAGNYTFEFDAHNLPSGLYLYSLSSGNYSVTKKMLLMK